MRAAWGKLGQATTQAALADLIVAEAGAAPNVAMLESSERVPWAGHSARYALGEVYQLIKAHRTTLVFVNTRRLSERVAHHLQERRSCEGRARSPAFGDALVSRSRATQSFPSLRRIQLALRR